MDKKDFIPYCPTATVISLLNSKWKVLILSHLYMRSWRFNELKRDLPGISQKVLTDSLRSLEADGLIHRIVLSETPPKVEYSLSELGLSMVPMARAMHEWGVYYMNQMGINPNSDEQA